MITTYYSVQLTLLNIAANAPPTFSIECVDLRNNQVKLDIKAVWYLQDQDTCDRIKSDWMDQEIPKDVGKVVRILDPLENITEVTVRKIPMYWSQQILRKIFKYEISHVQVSS